jgi:hypothetical protein
MTNPTQTEPAFLENFPELDFNVPELTSGESVELTRAGGKKVLDIVKLTTPEHVNPNQDFPDVDDLHEEMNPEEQ